MPYKKLTEKDLGNNSVKNIFKKESKGNNFDFYNEGEESKKCSGNEIENKITSKFKGKKVVYESIIFKKLIPVNNRSKSTNKKELNNYNLLLNLEDNFDDSIIMNHYLKNEYKKKVNFN